MSKSPNPSGPPCPQTVSRLDDIRTFLFGVEVDADMLRFPATRRIDGGHSKSPFGKRCRVTAGAVDEVATTEALGVCKLQERG